MRSGALFGGLACSYPYHFCVYSCSIDLLQGHFALVAILPTKEVRPEAIVSKAMPDKEVSTTK